MIVSGLNTGILMNGRITDFRKFVREDRQLHIYVSLRNRTGFSVFCVSVQLRQVANKVM